MLVRRTALVLVAAMLVAGPAGAAEPAPQVTDECGDAGTRGEWNGDSMELEETRPHLDIASAGVAGLYDEAGGIEGFTAAVTVCGEVSATEGGYHVGWGYGERCYGGLSWTLAGRERPDEEGISGSISAAGGPRAVLTEECYREQETPLDDGVDTIYTVELDPEAVVFEGDTLTFTVAASELPEAATARLAPGTQWAHIGALTMDQGPSMWAAYGDSEGNFGQLSVRTDFALGGADYVVGEDA